MNNTIFRKKLFIKELTSLAKEMARAVKGASPQERKENKALLKNYVNTVETAKKAVIQIKEQLPPIGALDTSFEAIIEKSKLAETKPTIENKQQYKDALSSFLNVYNSSSDEDKKLWKNAFEESKIEYEKTTKKHKDALAVKKRIDDFERTESAKIYCIIKGKNPDGSEWGRIDFVGMNYVTKDQDKVARGVADTNKLPLVVKYYSYEDKNYTHIKDSNHLESIFDKQLMDVFLKSNRTSYELYKNFDRDYEYHPKQAQIIGRGAWYVNQAKPNTTERIAKIIEVPDWNDFLFEDLFNQYLDDCGKGILTNTAGNILKKEMTLALEKQQGLINELETFHIEQNDGDKDSKLLIDIWKQRKGNFQESMSTLKNDCVSPYSSPEPCKDFRPIFDEHVTKCNANALPKRVADQLKIQMQDCIDNSKTSLQEMESALAKFKKIPNWEADKDVKQKVDDLQKQVEDRTQEIERQEKDLASLPDECILPIPLEVTFNNGNNKIATKDNKQLQEIAQLLINYPSTKIKLIGNTSISNKTKINKATPGVVEIVETDHIMPDDILPNGLSQQEIDSIRNRSTTPRDLMMIRAERVKQLLLNLGVNNDQIETVPGKNLGQPSSNQKVILEFY